MAKRTKTKTAQKEPSTRFYRWSADGDDCASLFVPESSRDAFASWCKDRCGSVELTDDGMASFNGLEMTEVAINASAEVSGVELRIVCYRYWNDKCPLGSA